METIRRFWFVLFMVPDLIKKLINRFGLVTIDQAIVSATSLIIGLAVAKILGLTIFGQYALVFVVMMLALEISRAAVITPMLSLAPKKPKKDQGGYFSTLAFLSIVLAIVLGLTLALFLLLSDRVFPKWELSEYCWITGGVIITRLTHEYYRRYFFVVNQPTKAILLDGATSVLLLVGLVFGQGVLGALTLRDVLLIYVIAYGVPVVKAWRDVDYVEINWAIIKETVIQHWKFGKWLLATVGVQYATNNTLILAAAALLGPTVAGSIRIAQYVMGALGALFQAMENVIPVKTSHLFHQFGFQSMGRYLLKVSGALTGISLAFAGVIYFVAPWFLTALFHRSVTSGVTVPMINGFAVLYLILPLSLCLVYALRAIEHTRPVFIAYTVTAALNMFLAIPLINRFGGMGVVYGMIGFQVLIMIIYGASLFCYHRQAQP